MSIPNRSTFLCARIPKLFELDHTSCDDHHYQQDNSKDLSDLLKNFLHLIILPDRFSDPDRADCSAVQDHRL